MSVSSKTVEASSPDQFCCLIFLISCILKNLFDCLRLLEFRPQIAKKAMPPKLPQDIEKTPSCGSKRGMDAIDLEQNDEMKEVEVVEITNEVETAPKRPRQSRYQSQLVRPNEHGKWGEFHVVVCLGWKIYIHNIHN